MSAPFVFDDSLRFCHHPVPEESHKNALITTTLDNVG
jgi:hypothetical protein